MKACFFTVLFTVLGNFVHAAPTMLDCQAVSPEASLRRFRTIKEPGGQHRHYGSLSFRHQDDTVGISFRITEVGMYGSTRILGEETRFVLRWGWVGQPVTLGSLPSLEELNVPTRITFGLRNTGKAQTIFHEEEMSCTQLERAF